MVEDDGLLKFDSPFNRLGERSHGWMVAFFAALVVVVLLAVGLYKVSISTRTVVHMYQVDAVGRVTYSGPPARLGESAEELVLRHELSEFVMDARTIVSDPKALFANWKRALEHAAVPVRNVMNAAINGDQDPRAVGKLLYREVQVQSILRRSALSWQVNWVEVDRFYGNGFVDQSTPWVAYMETRLEDSLVSRSNPLGLEITLLTWSPQVEGAS